MPAISVSKRTWFACNLGYKLDNIFMQFQIWYGLVMPALHKMRTISFEKHIICLKCRKLSWSHVTIIPERMFWNQIFDDCKHIMSVLKLKLQAYQNSIVIIIASIFSPFFGQNCMHIWSLLSKLMQPYLVHPYMLNIICIKYHLLL